MTPEEAGERTGNGRCGYALPLLQGCRVTSP